MKGLRLPRPELDAPRELKKLHSSIEKGMSLFNPQRYMPPRGSAGQMLSKIDARDYNTQWIFGLRSFFPMNYEAVGDGVADDTDAVQAAIDAAIASGVPSAVELGGYEYLVYTLTIDGTDVSIRGPGSLIANDDIPDAGAIILTLCGNTAGGPTDGDTNQALIDSAYSGAPSTPEVRSNVPGSIEHVHIDNVKFVSNSNAIKGIWATRFVRGSRVYGCEFDGFRDYDIAINGSWRYLVAENHGHGANDEGVGIGLGINGNGLGSGTSVCNAVRVVGNEMTEHDVACRWDQGSGGEVNANAWEFNASVGFDSQGATGFSYHGNYHEDNGSTTTNNKGNMILGGTNGSDFIIGATITANHFKNSSSGGHNLILRGLQYVEIGHNIFSGTRTQWYFITSGAGVYQSDCDIEIPDLTSTYANNIASEGRTGYNNFHAPDGRLFRTVQNGNYTTTVLDFARQIVKDAGTTGETITIDSQANVPCRRGSKIRLRNLGGGALTLAVTTDVLQWAGTTTTGSRTLADGGECEATLVLATADGDATDTWLVSGTGLT